MAKDLVDLPLALSGPRPHPVANDADLGFDIPRALTGVPYELALFDAAGRKSATVASGIASAGRHTRRMAFVRSDGSPMQNGVYFARLMIGSEIRTRIVVLAR